MEDSQPRNHQENHRQENLQKNHQENHQWNHYIRSPVKKVKNIAAEKKVNLVQVIENMPNIIN